MCWGPLGVGAATSRQPPCAPLTDDADARVACAAVDALGPPPELDPQATKPTASPTAPIAARILATTPGWPAARAGSGRRPTTDEDVGPEGLDTPGSIDVAAHAARHSEPALWAEMPLGPTGPWRNTLAPWPPPFA
jgi:hypothetical protein